MKNKTIRYIAVFFAAAFLPASCEDYLDYRPDDMLTLDAVFENVTSVDQWLANIYSLIPDTYVYGTAEPCGDDFVPPPLWEQFNFRPIQYQKGNWSPLSEGVFSYWTTVPRVIRSAHIFNDNVHVIPGLDRETVERMKAEADFLIAYYHSLLLMTHGAVPIIDRVYDSSSDDMMAVQQPFDVVVDRIDALLLSAAERLPRFYPHETQDYGRATSVMCHAIRARLLVFAASDLVNGNEDFRNFRNADDVPIFNPEYSRDKWLRAADACKQLIDLAETDKRHFLYKEYLSDGITIDPFLSYQNAVLKTFNEGNREILMDRPYSNGYAGWDKNSYPRGVGGQGALGVSQTLVDAFFMKDGTAPITGYENEAEMGAAPIFNQGAVLYSERGFSTADESRMTRWREGSSLGNSAGDENVVTTAGTFTMYCNREPRFYVSVLYNGAWCRFANRKTNFYMNGADGGPSHDSPAAGYLVRKKTDPDADPVRGTYKKRSAIIFRLAEAYLSYAEALNELGYEENRTEILKYINLVRERAGIAQYGRNGFFTPADGREMRRLIRQERRVELNCECFLRFDDIRRWKEAFRIDGNCYGMNWYGKQQSDDPSIVDAEGTRQAFFIREPYFQRKFISYWWPIPQSDIYKNPNLRQLPGW
ncbi:MAG: RagB/SusD family nutrient uptake outer membrane protein [Dysgonamonadaceae bacterium]|jgi:hypothetical protein|nr:RagB/SusD family nutrient uptake outer membrane protein [Dysgonamonadaceae bacterium]